MRGFARRFAQFIQRQIFHLRDGFGNFFHERRFTAFAAIRHGREIGTIRFQHEFSQRRRGDGVAHVLSVFERDQAGVTDKRTDFQNLVQSLDAFAEAMKNTAHFAGKRFKLCERVVERTALVNDAIQIGFGGDFELLLKNFRLPFFVMSIKFLKSARGDARPTLLRAGQTVVIEAAFADSHNFWMFCKSAQGRAQIRRRVQRVGRMPANDREQAFKFFRERDGAFAALQIRADANDFGDAGILRAREHVGKIWLKFGIVEVRVRIEKNRHDENYFDGALVG